MVPRFIGMVIPLRADEPRDQIGRLHILPQRGQVLTQSDISYPDGVFPKHPDSLICGDCSEPLSPWLTYCHCYEDD